MLTLEWCIACGEIDESEIDNDVDVTNANDVDVDNANDVDEANVERGDKSETVWVGV